MLAAEQKCRRIPITPWSPTLLQARRMATYWQLWISEILQKRSTALARGKIIEQFAPPGFSIPIFPPSLAAARRELKTAFKCLKNTIHQATELRESWLQSRAEYEASVKNHSTARIIRRIQAAEKMRILYNKLRMTFKPANKTGLGHILIPGSEPDSCEAVFDPSEITMKLLERNQHHFNQAQGTPFTIPPLSELLTWSGTSDSATAILDGRFPIEELSLPEAETTILRLLKRIEHREISTTISADDLSKAFRRWRESTSTSPSGRHLGHYKALLSGTTNDQRSEDGQSPASAQTRLMTIHSNFLTASLRHHHVCNRWRTVASAMLEKIPGQPKINKLRIIHIIEADLNLLMGILWGRRLLSLSIKHLNTQQWGSRAGGSQLMLHY